MGRAKDAPSSKVKGLFAETVLPRVRMDYCFLTERADSSEAAEEKDGESSGDGATVTVLVMQESLCKSVWAYAVQTKGSMEQWVVQQM